MKSWKNIRYDRLFFLIFIIFLMISGIFKIGNYFFSKVVAQTLYWSSHTEIATKDEYISPPAPPSQVFASTITSEDLFSKNVFLLERASKKTILDINGEDLIYPASLGKIMTVIIAIENIDNTSAVISVNPEIFAPLNTAGASMAGFLPGEEVSLMDLIYGALLPSGADAATSLALYVSPSESEFIELMNQKASKLKLQNTNFSNVTGLHDMQNYSTVQDLAILLDYSLENPIFRNAFTAQNHTVKSTNMHPEGFTMLSTLFRRLSSPYFDGGAILGGKTGYTRQAGLCMASLAEKDGSEFILVTTQASGDYQSEPLFITDAFTIYTNLSIDSP
ncbi:MAG: serine hydrolase [Syntrophomonadaceae bacterium]|jgi:D-alanyl-D-alanine carboxypeptidase (penicillin-binding protein 5/6)|nr:serine hydrolase [Syntrophomonadaceae bacterium]